MPLICQVSRSFGLLSKGQSRPSHQSSLRPRFATPSSGLQTPSYLLPIEMKTERGVREGKTLDIGFDAKQAFLFDRRSGERIR